MIVEMKFGSHLYGTNTPASDLDYKAVHLPDARSILLGRVQQVITTNTKSDNTARNTNDDVDRESYTLQKFLSLAAEGQTVAMDILFCTENMILQAGPIWRKVQANRDKLITSRAASFVGYCRTQANKYGIKGSRMGAARAIVEYLEPYAASSAKLHEVGAQLSAFVAGRDHMAIVEIASNAPGDGHNLMKHLEVCNRKMPFHATIKRAYEVYRSLFDEYGKRARQAEENQGVDWKALSHAVRVARECIELLETGHITFPRPEAPHLISIKTGALPYKQVAEEIEQLLLDAESAQARSSLREEPDREWIDGFVAETYRHVVTTQPPQRP